MKRPHQGKVSSAISLRPRANCTSSNRKEARIGLQGDHCSPAGSGPAKQAMLNEACQAMHGNKDQFDRYLIYAFFRLSALSENRDVAFLRLISFAAASDKRACYLHNHPYAGTHLAGVIQKCLTNKTVYKVRRPAAQKQTTMSDP